MEIDNLQFKRLQALFTDIGEMESIDVQHAYELVMEKVKRNRRKVFFEKMIRYAACLVLPLLVSTLLLGYFYFQKLDVAKQYAEVKASIGSVVRHELPDGSVVWLNGGSSLSYPVVFSANERRVSLKGEAYFEVKADQQNPFYVNTSSGLVVHVYGTKFNVTAYEDDTCVETVLEQGKVNLQTPDHKTYVMNPGQQALYDRKTHSMMIDNTEVYAQVAWINGKMVFRNTPLMTLFKRLERKFNVEIKVNNRSGKDYNYRATFQEETLSQILDYLSQSIPLKWKTVEAVQQADNTFSKKTIIVDLY